MNYLIDYHIHSNHSSDGKDSIFELCKSALKKGVKEIAITDHFEPSPGNEDYKFYKPNDYLMDIMTAKEFFSNKLEIKLGLELGQPHLFLNSSNEVIKKIPYDYIIGSAHKLASGIDFSEIDYEKYNSDDMCDRYIQQLKQLVILSDFDCIGHVDLIKRYCTSIYKKRISLIVKKEILSEVFKLLISKGRGIEINTSGLRQSPKETMPGVDVLKLYHELGGEILTIGSDAHNSNDLGKGLEIGISNARDAGFRYLTLFNNRVPDFIKIEESMSFFYISKKEVI